MTRIITVILGLILLVGCVPDNGGPDVTIVFPPTPIPTNTPEPPFLGYDCYGDPINPQFRPLNTNPCLSGENIEFPIGQGPVDNPDGRWACSPDSYTSRQIPNEIPTGAWVHCETRTLFGVVSPVLNMDVSFVDGIHGWEQDVTFHPGVCSIVKVTGRYRLQSDLGTLDNIDMGGEIEVGDIIVNLGLQTLHDPSNPLRTGDFEVFWIVYPDPLREINQSTVKVSWFIFLRFGNVEGQVEFHTLEVTTAPDDYCSLGIEIGF